MLLELSQLQNLQTFGKITNVGSGKMFVDAASNTDIKKYIGQDQSSLNVVGKKDAP